MKLADYARSEFCNHGQDGVIEKLIELCGTITKYFVEFGSSGTDYGGGNTPWLRRSGWDGLLMDRSVALQAQYEIYQEKITAGNIESLLEKYKVPKKFGFLSIDIDGQDYWVWKAIIDWIPDIVCIESNHYVEGSVSVPLDDDFEMTNGYYFGASRKALLKLGKEKGYSLVAICVTDMIFCRNGILPASIGSVNYLLGLDTAQTLAWVSRPIREEVGKMKWVNVA